MNYSKEKRSTRTKPTILLEIFCEFKFNFKVISKGITGADNTCEEDLQA